MGHCSGLMAVSFGVFNNFFPTVKKMEDLVCGAAETTVYLIYTVISAAARDAALIEIKWKQTSLQSSALSTNTPAPSAASASFLRDS